MAESGVSVNVLLGGGPSFLAGHTRALIQSQGSRSHCVKPMNRQNEFDSVALFQMT